MSIFAIWRFFSPILHVLNTKHDNYLVFVFRLLPCHLIYPQNSLFLKFHWKGQDCPMASHFKMDWDTCWPSYAFDTSLNSVKGPSQFLHPSFNWQTMLIYTPFSQASWHWSAEYKTFETISYAVTQFIKCVTNSPYIEWQINYMLQYITKEVSNKK